MSAPPTGTEDVQEPANLTQWLRDRDDAQLAELLRRRPDLGLPAPADLPGLASRISVRTSVQRAVDALHGLHLAVLEALLLVSDVNSRANVDQAAELLGTIDTDTIADAVDELLALALVWGRPPAVHLVSGVRESLGMYPAGLGRPAAVLLRGSAISVLAATDFANPTKLREHLDATPPDERDVLERLAAGPPIGSVRNAQVPTADDDAPHRLIARGLLVPIDAQRVELPREIGLALRTTPIGAVSPRPPDIKIVEHEAAELDRLGSTAVLETLRLIDTLGQEWSDHPPALLRAGGLGVRDLRRTGRALDVDEPTAALLAEVAVAAGLINSTTGIEPVYLPTEQFDDWRALAPAARWVPLAEAWMAMSRQPSLVTQRGERDRMITALSPDAERGTIPALRTRVLDLLSELPPGASPVDPVSVLTRMAWLSPRRAPGQLPLAAAILAEADILGVTAAGGLTGYVRTLRGGSHAVAEQVLTDAMPAPVEEFLVQPDLTVVVPGPPTRELARELALVADLESSGGASVYRITEASVRRALDAGRIAAELSAFITDRSRTPVPQALSYLITDTAKRHGSLRTGVAAAYLRCDDEALLARVLVDKSLTALQLRRIAPTVAICSVSVGQLLDGLRGSGYAPAAESADGEVVSLLQQAPRAPSRPPNRSFSARAGDSGGSRFETVRRIRSGDALTVLTRRVPPLVQQLPGVTSAATMGLIRRAIREGRRVLLGCAEADGTATRHTILPISMAGGFVRGHEAETQRLATFPLHRITAVTLIEDDPELDDDSVDPA
ncbi:MAG: helicase-associated domain-containing protein [Jatrophihabitantaceae bacterium]